MTDMPLNNEAELGRPLRSPTNSEEGQDVLTSPMAESISEIEYEGMTRSQALNLYTSHFLSTWNVRAYEFAAIIFTAAAYPDTLVAAAIRGIVRTLASICLSSVVGKWVDRSPNRLKTLLSTISVNRFSVISASVLWLFIVSPETSNGDGTLEGHDIGGLPISLIIKGGIFCLILALGILENLSASGNLLSMERDWVVTASASDGHPYDLTHLNSIMRRIDLICKLIAPILISVIVSVTNTRTGVLVVGSMSAASLGFEWWCAKRVWDFNPQLQAPKTVEEEPNLGGNNQAFQPQSFWSKTTVGFRGYRQDFKNYFSSTVWIPSLSLSFLHISALAYSATLITFLLNVGFSLDLITVARAAGSVVEIFSTVATPVGVHYLSKAKNHGRFRGQDMSSDGSILADDSTTVLLEGAPKEASGTETGLERLGLWGISWQLLNLMPVLYALWSLSPSSNRTHSPLPHLVSRLLSPMTTQPLLAFTLFTFLSLSRLGLWIFDLTTQQLTQTMVSPSQRSSFTGVEYSFVSLFELCQHIVTILLHKPEQFKWIALMSWCTVGVSTVAYAGWVWKMRGHLVHWERIGKGCECVKLRR